MSDRRLKLLIVAHAFPPQNATASHRAYSWARTWTDLGHEVHVLTPIKGAFDGSMDFKCDLKGIHVHEVPYALARRSAGHDGDMTGSALVRAERWDWLKTLTRRARFSAAMFGDPRWLACGPMVRHGLRLIEAAPFNAIIATSPPEVTFCVARRLALRARTPWIADFRDLWFRDMRLHQSRIASWLSGPVNRWLVKQASHLVTVSEGLQQRLERYLRREVALSYNGYLDTGQASSVAFHWSDERRHVVYTGRMYPGKRDPEPLFRALEQLSRESPGACARVCVDFYGFDDPWLRALIAKHRVERHVVVHGFVPFHESVRIQRAADALLFLDWTDAQAEGILTGKLFEYFASARPILSIGRRNDTEAARLIADTQSGTTVTTVDEIAGYLRNLAQSERPPDVVMKNMQRFSRTRQARELLVLMDRIARARP
jgi:glycosyltransferase involved in cell wall biosynthesis